ncbi:LytTR family DNA-binding domain-containing protein [Sphingopyxis terrae]|uniref:Transcriptional regulator, LytTR family n=1 Tax=Sphingopyxis terrae subsp. ummariensis TaxID=429001 RepID=A0A1Y6EPN7_9SPHN|nr:LytTR family DNA-binding domain-containing protein [Sphingopyxis terrae]PCF92454.1 LytTR family transcriptional regulator [Sphingopyxis terrae subsp. ummariensis]SMQ64239.1 transcriptional regulator, LytTR family [Sphingopyxis terrae subsp. ummariensis]
MTEKDRPGTNGGGTGTSRFSVRQMTLLAFGALLAYGLIRITSNVYSYLAERHAFGRDVPVSTAWAYEATSLAAWLVLIIACWFGVAALRPPRFGWAATVAIHAALALPVSLAHIALMVGLRMLVWWVAGETYHFEAPDGSPLLYELRKDVATYAELILLIFLMQWLIARYAVPPATEGALQMLAVADRSVTHQLPVAEIEHITAAANYVEIAWRGHRLLHRATLAAIEADLAGAGFVRIHRSRLIRRDAVRRIVTHKSGDFEVEMESGEMLRGSRRFRENLEG